VTISSEPAGVQVYLDGALLGNTPFKLEKPTGDDKLEIELRHPGYTEQKVQIAALTGNNVKISLRQQRTVSSRPRPSPTPTPSAPTPTKAPSKRPATEVLDPWD
jgi:hypothetical protein